MTNLNETQKNILDAAVQIQGIVQSVVDVFNRSLDIFMQYSQNTVTIELVDIPENEENSDKFGLLKQVDKDHYVLQTSVWQSSLVESMGSGIGKMALCAAVYNTTSVETLFDRNKELERLGTEALNGDLKRDPGFWLMHIDSIVGMCGFDSVRFESAPYEDLLKQYDVDFPGFCRLVALYESGLLDPESTIQKLYIESKEPAHQVTIPLYALAEALCQPQ